MTEILFGLLMAAAPVALALVVSEEARIRRWTRQARRDARKRTGLEGCGNDKG